MWESEHICLHTRLSLHTQNRPLEDKSIGWSIEHINGGSGIKSGIWAREAEAGELWVKGKPILHRKILAYKNKWSLRKKTKTKWRRWRKSNGGLSKRVELQAKEEKKSWEDGSVNYVTTCWARVEPWVWGRGLLMPVTLVLVGKRSKSERLGKTDIWRWRARETQKRDMSLEGVQRIKRWLEPNL